MKIESITTEVRPRIAWESIDLGIRMVQTWVRTIVLSWLLYVIPVYIVIFILFWDQALLTLFLIWWLKPIFARIPLYIVSHAVFGDIPTLAEVRAALPEILLPHLIKTLFWYRFDPARSFNLPVWQLEGLSGETRVKRARILQKGVYGTAVSLTYFCLFVQLLLWTGCYAVLFIIMPSNINSNEFNFLVFDNDILLPNLIMTSFAVITLSIIEPLYIAGGFSLYLNRRTHLEAWDIELKFRHLAKRNTRNKSEPGKISNIILILITTATLFSFSNEPVYAEQVDLDNNTATEFPTSNSKPYYKSLSNKQAKTIVDKIYQTKEFNTKSTEKVWQLKEDLFKDLDKNTKSNEGSFWASFFAGLFGIIISYLIYILLGLFVFILIIYLFYKLIKYLPKNLLIVKPRNKKTDTINQFRGLDLSPESLPSDIGASAWQLSQAGDLIAAISLLYRASLSSFIHHHGLQLKQSATEGQCLRIIKNKLSNEKKDQVNYFESVSLMWQRAAYANRFPEIFEIEKVCQNWSKFFIINNDA